jgi:hypothetical protein
MSDAELLGILPKLTLHDRRFLFRADMPVGQRMRAYRYPGYRTEANNLARQGVLRRRTLFLKKKWVTVYEWTEATVRLREMSAALWKTEAALRVAAMWRTNGGSVK